MQAANPSSLPKLNPESLDFVPDCEIVGKEAVSAITRAKTQECKKHLVATTCKILNDELYPKKLPRFCKNKSEFTFTLLVIFAKEKEACS